MVRKISKILRFFRRIFHSDVNPHYRNVEKGERIIIDGKEFIKVQLKFVDTMDFNLSKHVNNIESENELLKQNLLELKEISEKNDIIINKLQIGLKNVFHENTRLKKEQNQKKEIVKTITKINNELNDIIKTQKGSLINKNQTIIELQSGNDILNRELSVTKEQLDTCNSKIEQLQNYIKNLLHDNKYLRDQKYKDEATLVLMAKITEQNKIIEVYKQKINDLKNTIKKL